MPRNTDELAQSVRVQTLDSTGHAGSNQVQLVARHRLRSGSSSDGPQSQVHDNASSIETVAWRERFPLIVHCHLRWDFVWQRPQQILSRLARQHRILFVEDPLFADEEPTLRITEPMPNVVRVVPVMPASGTSFDDQCRQTLLLLEHALQNHPLLAGQFEQPVQWFYSPMSSKVFMGGFGSVALVYDCMDELANFRFAPDGIAVREREVMARADIVFTGGYQLYESKSQHHSNVHFYGCGVDVEHFGSARLQHTRVPEVLDRLPQPRFGYFGVIDERIDYELVDALARRFPYAAIVMAGPVVKVDPAMLPQRPNIHWLGQQAYEDLPALVKGFDVCLMPFALNDATRYINPTKTLEYMAAGKPIVSTAVADVVRNFSPIVSVAADAAGFVEAVQRAWTEPDRQLLEEGLERAQGASWDATVASMRSDMQAAVSHLRLVA